MKRVLSLGIVLALAAWMLALPACILIKSAPPLGADAVADTDQAYLFGRFALAVPSEYRIHVAVEDTATGDELYLLLTADRDADVYAVPVPAAEYRLAELVVTEAGQLVRRIAIEDETIGAPFTVKPGELVYLGNFLGKLKHIENGITAATRIAYALALATERLGSSYPQLADRTPTTAWTPPVEAFETEI